MASPAPLTVVKSEALPLTVVKSEPADDTSTAAPASGGGWWDTIKDLGKGAIKGVGQTIAHLPDFLTPQGAMQAAMGDAPGAMFDPYTQASNATQSVGKIGAQIGSSFLMPGGAAAEAAEGLGGAAAGLAENYIPKAAASAVGRLAQLGTHAAVGAGTAGLQGEDPIAGAAGSAAGDVAGRAMERALPIAKTAMTVGSKILSPKVALAKALLGHVTDIGKPAAEEAPKLSNAVSRFLKTGAVGAASATGADLATGQDVTPESVATGAITANLAAGGKRAIRPGPPEIQTPNPRSRAAVVDNPNVLDTAQGWGDSRPLQADPRSSVRSPLDELRMAVSSQGPQLRSPSNVTDNPGVPDTDQSWVAPIQTPNPRSGATVVDQSAVQDTGDPWGSALPQAAAPHTSAPIEALRAAVSPAKAPAKAPTPAPSALDSFHVVNPDTATTQVNGSGSNVGGGSDEENRRLAAMATHGQQRIVRKRTGEIVNLNDPSHVDYRVQPGEIHGIAQANGDVEVHDKGEGVTPDALAALKAQVKKMRTTNAGVASTATAKPEPIHPEIRNLYEGLQPQLDLSRENHENGTAPLPASHPALNPMTLEQFADQTMNGDPKKLWSKQRAVRKLIEAERAAKTPKGGA